NACCMTGLRMRSSITIKSYMMHKLFETFTCVNNQRVACLPIFQNRGQILKEILLIQHDKLFESFRVALGATQAHITHYFNILTIMPRTIPLLGGDLPHVPLSDAMQETKGEMRKDERFGPLVNLEKRADILNYFGNTTFVFPLEYV
ncbi:hypothetical protein ACJX0J_017806, partial [Zea mays]